MSKNAFPYQYLNLLSLMLILLTVLPLSAQDAPLPLPYSGASAGIINRAPFEVPDDLLPLTRAPFSVTVTTTADPVVGSCNASDGMSLREALVNCSSPTVQPVVYLPSGVYTLTNSIVVLDQSFTVIGESPLSTFIEGSPTNLRYFDIGLSGIGQATFANLTLRNSTSGLSGNALRVGGNGTLMLDNVRVMNNSGSTRGAVRVDVESASTLTTVIRNTEFTGNSAASGGALAFTNELGSGTGVLNIQNSTFTGNSASGNGAGILVHTSSGTNTTIAITNSMISGNTITSGAALGGGLSVSGNGDKGILTITDSTIQSNTATGAGGGLSINNTGFDVVFTNVEVVLNTFATTGAGAGMLVNAARTVSVNDSLFDANDAKTGTVGAIQIDTAVGAVFFSNTVISNNKASSVGGIYVFLADSFTADNLTVTGNSATVDVGGALVAPTNFASLSNSNFTLNTALTEIGGLYISRATLLNVKIEDNSAPLRPDCSFNALSGTSTSLGGVGISDMNGCDGTFIPAASDQIDNLLVNGGFEVAGTAAGKPAGWTLKTITGDKRACNTTIKTLTPYGKCVMSFKGGSGENANISQNVDLTGLTFSTGEELRLYAMADGSSGASKLKLTVTAFYTDQPKNKTILSFNGNHPALTAQSQILTLTSGNVSKITVQIQHTSTGGTILLDRVYLTR